MNELKLWASLYKEFAELFSDKLDAVEWVDLWHNQVGFLDDEHPFPTPALFLGFRISSADDLSMKAQRLTVQMDVYYFYETFLDTFNEAYNQDDALAYLNTLSDIHALLHGSSGDCYSECKRVAFGAVDTGSAGNLYRQSFTMLVDDASASPADTSAIPGELNIEEGSGVAVEKVKAFIIR